MHRVTTGLLGLSQGFPKCQCYSHLGLNQLCHGNCPVCCGMFSREDKKNHREENSDLSEVWRKTIRVYKLDMQKYSKSSNNRHLCQVSVVIIIGKD